MAKRKMLDQADLVARVLDRMPVGTEVHWRRLSQICGTDVAYVVAALASLAHQGQVQRMASGRYRRNY